MAQGACSQTLFNVVLALEVGHAGVLVSAGDRGEHQIGKTGLGGGSEDGEGDWVGEVGHRYLDTRIGQRHGGA